MLTNTLSIQASKFIIIGISNTIISYVTFVIMFDFVTTHSAFLSQCISYSAGIVWSFIWNKNWTFENKQQSNSFFKFIITQVSLLLLSALSLNYCVNIFTIDAKIIWVFVMAIITVINFLLSKFWVFRV